MEAVDMNVVCMRVCVRVFPTDTFHFVYKSVKDRQSYKTHILSLHTLIPGVTMVTDYLSLCGIVVTQSIL